MTSNYKILDKIVKAKFGTFAAFSKMIHNNFRTLSSVQNLADNPGNKALVDGLILLANETTMNESKVYISDYDIKVIVGRMTVILEARSELIGKPYRLANWLRENKYTRLSWGNITKGRNMYKNHNYDRLIELLGIK